MKRKSLAAIIISVGVCSLFAGCGSEAADPEKSAGSGFSQIEENTSQPEENTLQEEKSEAEEVPASDSADEKTEDEVKKDEPVAPEADLKSEDGIRSFVAGSWTLLDRKTDTDFGTLTIEEDGTFDFVRTKDKAKGSGRLYFEYSVAKQGEEPDTFRLVFEDAKALVPDDIELYDNNGSGAETGGIFHIGCLAGKDYMYLKEIGNGDSPVSVYIFNSDENAEPGTWAYDWLFYRENAEHKATDVLKDDTFYAWAWANDSDGIWLQPMTAHEYETFEEYSNRRFIGGYFSEEADLMAACYKISDDADLSQLIEAGDFYSANPLMMYSIRTDKDGVIVEISEVDIGMYNVYEMGEAEPEYSYNGTVFTIEGFDIDMKEYVPLTDAILDCKKVGDWIIVECHINPNISAYEFYNICDGTMGYFQYEILGGIFKWKDDDLSTGMYTYYNDIYDFWGHRIGHIDNGEISDITYIDDETIGVNCWCIDDNGNEKEYTEKFEYIPHDSAMFAYYEYMLGGAKQWRRFRQMAPADATAFVMVNPPQCILDRLPSPYEYEKNGLDTVAVVGLTGKQEVYIEPMEPDETGETGKWRDVRELGRGNAAVYTITVPEGMPVNRLVVSTEGFDLVWDVFQLSGRIPLKSTFLAQ